LIAAPHPDLERYHVSTETKSDGQAIEGRAFDIVWTPSTSSALSLMSGGGEVLALERVDGNIVATRGAEKWDVPYSSGDVRVILDGPVAEVSSSGGIFGIAVEQRGDSLTLAASAGSACVIRTLERRTV
jgi:beta-fructofuranosidase